VAIRQYFLPYAWHRPYAVREWQWWLHPMEWNIDDGLPQITGDINAIVTTRDGACLWIAGNAGLLAFSSDMGKNWARLQYDAATRDFRAPAGTKPCVATKTANGTNSWLSVVPTAYAQSAQSSNQQQAQRPAGGQSLPEQTQQTMPASNNPSGKLPSSNQSSQSASAQTKGSLALPSLQVFPAQVIFSSAVVNSTLPPPRAWVHVKNVSQAPVSLSRVAVFPSIFRVDSEQQDTCSDKGLLPGTECIVPLAFSPTKAGNFQGQLEFSSSNQVQPWLVDLFGTGDEAPSPSPSRTETGTSNKAAGTTLSPPTAGGLREPLRCRRSRRIYGDSRIR
jgi:hypothetical protein